MYKTPLYFFLFLASIVLGLKSTAKATLLNENAGLKNIEVTAIAKDKSGLMWVGTKGGLNKYDGYGFQAITYFEKHSVNTILYDSLRDVLWIGTNWGLYYFICKTNQIVQCTPKLRKNAVTCLLKVEDRIVVGFEEKYILQINADFSCKVIYYSGTNHLLVNRMVADSKGNIYCCFKVLNNIVKINAATHVTTILSNQSTYGIDVLAIFENELYAGGVDNGFWNITRTGKSTWFLDDLNIQNHHPEFVLHHNQKIFLSYRNDSKIFEVNQVDRKIIDLSNQDKDVFNYKRIFSFFCDDYGVVWIGTSKGLIKLTPDKPKIPFEKLLNQWSEQVSTRQILEDDNGDIYVGSYAGFFRFNKRKQQWNNWRTILFKGKKSEFAPRSLLNAGERYIYIGSDANSFGRFDKHKQSFEVLFYQSADGVCNTEGAILSLVQDANGLIWLGSDNGLMSLDTAQSLLKCHFNDQYGVDNAAVRYIHLLPGKKQFWAGTEKGIYLIDVEKGRLLHLDVNTTPALSDNNVNAITTDQVGNVWIATDMGGLNVLSVDYKNIFTITRKDGLSSNEVYHFLWQDSTRLWVSTYNGLNYYHVPSKTITSYYEIDGITNNEFNQNSALRTADGKMYFGGIQGLTAFTPPVLDTVQKPFEIFVTSISKWDKTSDSYQNITIENQQQIAIQPGDNLLTFTFAGTDYTNPELNTYFYRIEGLHSDWISLGAQPTLRLESLKGGEYKLLIKAVKGSRGQASRNVLSYNLSIGQEFYRTVWFYMLFALLLAGLIYFYFLNRLNTQKELELLRVKIASNLHDEVGSLLTRITMSSDRLVARLSRDSETRDKLESVSKLSRAANAAMSDVLWTIDARNDIAGSLTDRMREHAEDLLLPRGIEVMIDFNEVDQLEKVSPEFRQNLFLLYKEIINNIIKHSTSSIVEIEYKQIKAHYLLRVKNDGVTIKEGSVSTGQGIRNIKMRAEMIKGKATIKQEGDTFEVIVSV